MSDPTEHPRDLDKAPPPKVKLDADLDPAVAKRISDAVRMFGMLGCTAETVQRVHRGEDVGDLMMEVAIKHELEVAE